MEAPIPSNEPARLGALRECDALSEGVSQSLDAAARLAAHISQAPIALVSLVGSDEQHFVGRFGLCVPGTGRKESFCAWAILGSTTMEIEDATKDDRFRDNVLVTGEPFIRFYAGVPLRTGDGMPLGALCVIDRRARTLTDDQRTQLELLATQVATQLDLRRWRTRCAGAREQAERGTASAGVAERLLAEAEARAALILDGAMDAVVTADEHGVITRWNAQAEAVFGYPAGQAMGRSLAELIVPERDREAHRAALRRAAGAGGVAGVHRRVEVMARRADGNEIPVEMSITIGHQGGKVFFNAFLRDITERLRASAELRRAKEAAEAAARAKSDFLANMSHEIRTPMTGVLGYAELLADAEFSQDPSRRAEAIGTIRRNAEQLLAIINDVLDVSRIDAGKLSVEQVPTDPREVLGDVVRLMSVRAAAKSLRIESSVAPGVPASVLSDPVRLHQILLNLVSNAVKFTDRGSVRVHLTSCEGPGGAGVGGTGSTGGRVELDFAVHDTGVGIAPEHVGRLFDSFWQEDASMTRRFGGTGLGLHISRALAHLLGGDIEVESLPGRGSTFTLRVSAGLPASARPGCGADNAPANLEGVRILLAEDGPDNQRLLAHHLRTAGAQVTLADNGEEAIEHVSRADPSADRGGFHLIIMDMQMPRMDGYAAVRALRQRGITTPILALTAHALTSDRERCLAIGCDAFATKPIDRGTLLRTCAQLVGAGRRSCVHAQCPATP